MTDPVAGYDAYAERLAERYESIEADRVHAAFLDFLPAGAQRLALDVGAGSGRDAAWLASRNFEVVAVEPSDRMRAEAVRRHGTVGVRWLADRLPDLGRVHALGLSFDVILLSGVFMHISPKERPRAFRKLVTLLKPGGLLLISVRDGIGHPERPMWEVTTGELEALARAHGLAVLERSASTDQLGRDDVHWTSFALRLPDDASGALPLLRGVILNDDKSSTYKLALVRAVAKVADAAPALARPDPDDDVVHVPLDLIALNWVRMYLPLVAAGLPQLPGNDGPARLGFAKAGFRDLLAQGVSGQDLRLGATFSGARALAVGQALGEARRTICDMPVRYTRFPNSELQIFAAARAPARRPRTALTLDAETLQAAGSLAVPGHVWRTLQRLGAWIEPVLVTEWSRLIGAYAERMGREVSPATIEAALRWLDPVRDTLLARDVARRLMGAGQPVHCIWTGSILRPADLDIDHCLPWSAWPCGDLWNLFPSGRRVNQHLKRDRLPSSAALAGARDDVLRWWSTAWEADPALGARFHREAAGALAVTPTADLEELFSGLEWRRLRLWQDQQVQEWLGARVSL